MNEQTTTEKKVYNNPDQLNYADLTEEEKDIFRRGRNAKKPSHAKNAKVSEYNKSTGIEAVIGFLYLCDDEERLNYVLNYQIEEENDEG